MCRVGGHEKQLNSPERCSGGPPQTLAENTSGQSAPRPEIPCSSILNLRRSGSFLRNLTSRSRRSNSKKKQQKGHGSRTGQPIKGRDSIPDTERRRTENDQIGVEKSRPIKRLNRESLAVGRSCMPLSRLGTAAQQRSVPFPRKQGMRTGHVALISNRGPLPCQQQLGFAGRHGSAVVSNICLTPPPLRPSAAHACQLVWNWNHLLATNSGCSYSMFVFPPLSVSGSAIQFFPLPAKGYAAKEIYSTLSALNYIGYFNFFTVKAF